MAVRLQFRMASIRWCQRHHLPGPHSSSSIPNPVKLNPRFSTSSSSSSSHQCIDEECDDYLSWLRGKAGAEISSVLSVGQSNHGRSLFASKLIQAGDIILKVPYHAQLAPDNLPPELNSFVGDKVGNVAKLALVILVQQKLGQDSEWAPYISRLPQVRKMHSTMFWSDNELKAIQKSSLYQQTIKRNEEIEKDFLVIKSVLDQFPEIFEDVTLNNFKHAYGLVVSRAWNSTKGVSMIPFADFLNHDGGSESDVMCFEDEAVSEVVAGCNYVPGDQVTIRYGKFSNATLLLDFGFTVPCNKYDQVLTSLLSKVLGSHLLPLVQVQLEFTIPQYDHLQSMKSELLQSDTTQTVKDCNSLSSFKNCFTIKEVKSASGKGKGIPQSLRAFCRVLCCTTPQELHDLATEAAQNDGRIARRPMKNRTREIQAHQLLLSRINQILDEHNAFIKTLNSPCFSRNLALRMELARELLNGEVRVLQSASAWLTNYCTNLSRNTQ